MELQKITGSKKKPMVPVMGTTREPTMADALRQVSKEYFGYETYLTKPTENVIKPRYLSDVLGEDNLLIKASRKLLSDRTRERLGIDEREPLLSIMDTQTDLMLKKNPELIQPQAYYERGFSLGWKNKELPDPVTKDQKIAQVGGTIAGIASVRLIMSSAGVVEAALRPILKYPKVKAAYDAVSILAKTRPWSVGWAKEVLKSGAWGAFIGSISQADTQEEWISNIQKTAGSYAAFSALAYPIFQFFRPVYMELGEGRGDILVSEDIKDKLPPGEYLEGGLGYAEGKETLYFRHPNNPDLYLEVTENSISSYSYSTLAEEQGRMIKESSKIFKQYDYKAFYHKPSLYNSLKEWVTKGKDFILPLEDTPTLLGEATTDIVAKGLTGDVVRPPVIDIKPSDITSLSEELPRAVQSMVPEVIELGPTKLDDIPKIGDPKKIVNRKTPTKIFDGKPVILPDSPTTYTDHYMLLNDRTPEEVQKWTEELAKSSGIDAGETAHKPNDVIKMAADKKPTHKLEKPIAITGDSNNKPIANFDIGQKYPVAINAEAVNWLKKEGYELYASDEPLYQVLIRKNGKDVGAVMPVSPDKTTSEIYKAIGKKEPSKAVKIKIERDIQNTLYVPEKEIPNKLGEGTYGFQDAETINNYRGDLRQVSISPSANIISENSNEFKTIKAEAKDKSIKEVALSNGVDGVKGTNPKTGTVIFNDSVIEKSQYEGEVKIKFPVKDSPRTLQNKRFYEAFKRLHNDPDNLTSEDIKAIAAGRIQQMTPDGIKDVDDVLETENALMKLYAGFNPFEYSDEILATYKGVKKFLIERIGIEFMKYSGLSKEAKLDFIKLQGEQDLLAEDMELLFSKTFPLSEEDLILLNYHQGNPEKYPIPKELEKYAQINEGLRSLSEQLQRSRNLQSEFFPQNFISRNEDLIHKYKKEIPMLTQEKAIQRRLDKISELEKENEELSKLRYAPQEYLQFSFYETGQDRSLAGRRRDKKFSSELEKLKGRRIKSLDEAKELGLDPEENIAVLWANHFTYLFKKIAIHDTIEALKNRPEVMLPEEEAPADWKPYNIEQLDGYKVHPTMISAIQEYIGKADDRTIFGRGYDAVNQLGKTLTFYNPIRMSTNNAIQAFMGGGPKAFRSLFPQLSKLTDSELNDEIKKLKIFNSKAAEEVSNRGELYRQAVMYGLFYPSSSTRLPQDVGEAVRLQIEHMDKKYPKWRKQIEKLIGRPLMDKDKLIAPALYDAIWKLTWQIDRIQRMSTVMGYLNKYQDSINPEQAILLAKRWHADYDLLKEPVKKWGNRIFLVLPYKVAMLVDVPSFVIKETAGLFKSIGKGQSPTFEQKEAGLSLLRAFLLYGIIIGGLGLAGYKLQEGYRLVKKLKEPKVKKDGTVVYERTIILPGPGMEWVKLIQRTKYGPKALAIYLAKVPQIAAGWTSNRRWDGSTYVTKGASAQYQARELIINTIRDYVAPIDDMMRYSDEENEAIYGILSLLSLSVYERGSTEQRISYEILNDLDNLAKFLKRQNVLQKDKENAAKYFNKKAEKLLEELEDFKDFFDK